ncbi:MAG: 2-polyprenyl-6-hydroxyphenyl methylase/3-demethylubiquinone-9 3-methyltransferase [Hyphomicrobiaceae bacterium]
MSMATADALFDRDGWWDPNCREFASLRAVSAFRLQLLKQWLGDAWRDRIVVDLGCGGGLLAVPLARSGAQVIGLDIAPLALRAARKAADSEAQSDTRFLPIVAEMHASPVRGGQADVVLLADVLEHVEDPGAAVTEAARLMRPGGSLFVNTIDRSLRSRLLAIWLGEGLGFVPKGTHLWSMFIRPSELDAMASRAGLRRVQLTGEAPNLLATVRNRAVSLRESRSTAVGYAALFVKEAS